MPELIKSKYDFITFMISRSNTLEMTKNDLIALNSKIRKTLTDIQKIVYST